MSQNEGDGNNAEILNKITEKINNIEQTKKIKVPLEISPWSSSLY